MVYGRKTLVHVTTCSVQITVHVHVHVCICMYMYVLLLHCPEPVSPCMIAHWLQYLAYDVGYRAPPDVTMMAV